MIRKSILILLAFLCTTSLHVKGQTREELERQRNSLKKEIKEAERLLNENKKQTSENFLQWKLVNNKVNLQSKVVENIGRDLNVLDNDVYRMQLDINKFGRILDTLKK